MNMIFYTAYSMNFAFQVSSFNKDKVIKFRFKVGLIIGSVTWLTTLDDSKCAILP